MKKIIIRILASFVLALTLVNCGSGDNPSISVQPSQDVFEQEVIERVANIDILWVVDTSGSMRSYQEKVEDEIVSFINNFTSKDLNDFQIGFIGTHAWQDLNINNYSQWNDFNGSGFLVEDLPFDDETGVGYDYSSDLENRLSGTGNSRLESVTCSICNDGSGRSVSIFDNELLNELRQYCENPLNNCNGDDEFADLIRQTITSLGTDETGDERTMQSFQAAILNPENSSFFRKNTHLALVMLSDEEDVSRPSQGDLGSCASLSSDSTGFYTCNNLIPTNYYKEFLDLASNPFLGSSVHALVINSVSTHPDNAIAPEDEYDDPNVGDGPFRRTRTFFNPSVLECRTANILGGANGFERFFALRTSELANLTDGVIASLCGDYAVSLDNISRTILEQNFEFFLGDNVPSQETLDQGLVFVAVRNVGESEFTPINRDQTQQDGWDYNASNNSIVIFGDSIPENGAEVSVVFDRQSF